jgi:hypothetical protein
MTTGEQELEEDDPTPLIGKEVDWVKSITAAIQTAFHQNITVKSGVRLPYTLHVFSYRQKSPQITKNLYQTDLLIAEELDGSMVPRVVVEFKLGGFTTHDALTYSAKAATHKNVHPYLRYGVVIARGEARQVISSKMMRHGQHFDFMLIIEPGKLSAADRKRLCELLTDEIHASEELERLLQSKKTNIRLVHRKLVTC